MGMEVVGREGECEGIELFLRVELWEESKSNGRR